MIFLTAFTNSIIVKEYKHKRRTGQFLEEYKWLLRSINKHYPESIAVLYNFEGIVNPNELKAIHQKTIIFNWNKKFREELGIDLNYLIALKETLSLFDDDIIMIDPDCLIVKRFDELLNDDVDITAATRGPVKWNGVYHNLIFAPAIYHNRRKDALFSYISKLYLKAYLTGEQTKDYWSNVQASMNEIFFAAGMKLECDMEKFTPEYGEAEIQNQRIKLKVIPQYILSYPIQEEKYYPETCIIHYKNYKDRNHPETVYKNWIKRNA